MGQTIGILGGMGPEATVYLFDQVIRFTKAQRDQEHIPIIIWNNPTIPDRTQAILAGSPSPLPILVEGARWLEKGGADIILMPCVTAHFYYDEIVKHISVPFLNLMDITYQYVETHFPGAKRIGLIATTGTIQAGLFQVIFNRCGRQILVPDSFHMQLFMDCVYREDGIKAGYKEGPKQKMIKIVRNLLSQEVDAIIAGCTEIPLVLNQEDLDIPFINPLQILACESIRISGYPLKPLPTIAKTVR